MESSDFTICTHAAEETEALGTKLAPMLAAGDVVGLDGDLGAGKTTLIKGLARALTDEKNLEVTSPTFVLLHEYTGRLPVFHMDCYRLKDAREAEEAGLDEFFYEDGVTLIEWAERVRELLPAHTLFLHFAIQGATLRNIRFSGLAEKIRNIAQTLEIRG